MKAARLTARSVVLSVLLGAHPAWATAGELVALTAGFGIKESALRVALTRMVAAGDLVRSADGYRLADRLLARQRRQDDALHPATTAWDGNWITCVVTDIGADARARAGLRTAAAGPVAGRAIAGDLCRLRRADGCAAHTDGGAMTAVRVERNGPVTTVILNRPHARNAVDGPTALELYEAFEEFDRDASASVAVLWGDGGTFCAGADLKAIGTEQSNPTHPIRTESDVAGPAAPAPMGPSRMELSKPVIAAVSGYAVAGGMELALWCDMRVVEESATFGVFCRRWGVPLIDGGTVRLPRLIGHSRAMDLILTGRAVDAAEALGMGLANRVVPDGQARRAAEELAAELAALPQGCLRADRLSAIRQWGMGEQDAMAVEFGSLSTVAAESVAGARRFADGAGRHGAPG